MGMMSKTLEITCVRKDPRYDPYRAIQSIGGYDGGGWEYTLNHAIRLIETGQRQFYVERPRGDRVKVVVAVSRYGNKYLRTVADADAPNNLLSLPECR